MKYDLGGYFSFVCLFVCFSAWQERLPRGTLPSVANPAQLHRAHIEAASEMAETARYLQIIVANWTGFKRMVTNYASEQWLIYFWEDV